MIRFNIEPQLKSEWEPVLSRQLRLLLTPVLANVKTGSIHFYTQIDPAVSETYYCCEFQGDGFSDEIFYAYTQNLDGRIAIRDALSRVRRAVIRKSQHAILRAKIA